ncbi:MAG: ORF6N domain-containing protein [Bacteroidota bacterium]
MNDISNQYTLNEETIISKILFIRGQKVMIDADLAEMFGVTTKRLNEQVRRNLKRFPEHFMFILSQEEKENVVAICDHLKKLKYSPHLPSVFTEHGIIMLSSVLNSEIAIKVSVRIVEVFIKMREMFIMHKELITELEQIKKRISNHDEHFLLIFKYMKQFEEARQQQLEQTNRKKIGYKKSEE